MITDSIARIRRSIAEKRITKKALADASGLHYNTLRGVEDETWNPSAATILKLEENLPADGEAA